MSASGGAIRAECLGKEAVEAEMIISSKGEYALRMLAYLADHRGEGPLILKEISDKLGLSEKYMEGIAKNLVRSGILTAVRGKGGGYSFRRDPDRITLWEVLSVTERDLKVCKDMDVSTSTNWHLLDIIQGLERSIQGYLSRYTISDLMLRDQAGDDYVI